MTAKGAKAYAKGAKAQAKAMRPWYKKKRFIVLGPVLIFIVTMIAIGAASDDPKDSATSSGSNKAAPAATDSDDHEAGDAGSKIACKDAGPDEKIDTQNQSLYPDRPDSQKEDHEAVLGDCVRVAGYTAFVKDAAVQTEDMGGTNIVINVSVQNRNDESQPFNQFNWTLLTPGGTVMDPTIYFGDDGFSSGALVKGGEATGKIAFDESEAGTYYVIYKPDAFNSARGVWKIEV